MTAKAIKISTIGEWITRDKDRWIVKVPCQGGYGVFPISEYGGSSVKALMAARGFHTKMDKQLKKDRVYYQKHGEMPKRETLNCRNRTGHTGISRDVHPCLDGRATVVFTVYWNKNRRQISKRFSTVEFKHEEYALQAAIKFKKKVRG